MRSMPATRGIRHRSLGGSRQNRTGGRCGFPQYTLDPFRATAAPDFRAAQELVAAAISFQVGLGSPAATT
jgi:hypothetical protein